MIQFNVLWWDVNRKDIVPYDVLPYFRNKYKELKKKERPVTEEQWHEFVKHKGMYRFWGQCQYEFLVSEWPTPVNPEKDKRVKVDIWQQIEPNIDLIVKLLMEEYQNGSKH